MATASSSSSKKVTTSSVVSGRSCQFCGDYLGTGAAVILRKCLHVYCRNCITTWIQNKIAEDTIKCPGAGDGACNKIISESELKKILPPKVFEKYQTSQVLNVLNGSEDFIQCKNVACGEWIEFDGNGRSFICPGCSARNCLECRNVHNVGPCDQLTPKRQSPPSNRGKVVVSKRSISASPLSDENRMQTRSRSRNPAAQRSNILLPPPQESETSFSCSTCQQCSAPFLQMEEAIMLQMCSHVYCRKCLQRAIENSTKTPIPCLVFDKQKCGGYLMEQEVKALVSADVFEEYLNMSLAQAQTGMANVFLCKTPLCKGWCEFETGRKTFQCPVCKQVNCLECKFIHDGMSCEVFQNLSRSGQLHKVQELMDKERKNGWSQLKHLMQGSENVDPEGELQKMLTTNVLISNTMEFECAICFLDIESGDGVILQDCLHMFCKECLIGLVDNSDEPIVKCPFIDGNYSCVSTLQEREIKALVPPNVYAKHLQVSMSIGENSIENSFHCKTPDCPGWCEFEVGAVQFNCTNCGKINCIRCNVQHPGVSCEDYKNRLVQNENDLLSEKAVEDLIRTGEYMRCPKCKIPVKKAIGCDWLQCPACRTEICWVTRGPRWGPKGRGDTSGGCRCNYAVKKCHPQCGNCH